MSSLWTPGGEVPVERNPAPSTSPGDDQEPTDVGPDPGQQEQIEQLQRQLLEAPAADVIAQHVMAFFELAAMHLGAEEPRLADAQVAIDAIDAVLSGLAGRLGPAEEAISSALPQLKMAFVETKDRVE
ncbi:hypothetical protein [Actinospongicola halichondriae]|uniref:hypothetical protein n=1 Tax=Actinospongicola halichondriae TaxID=3236844 RepID=UPI003D4A46D5